MQRTNNTIFIDDNEYTFNNIVESVLELYRFLLIVLSKIMNMMFYPHLQVI